MHQLIHTAFASVTIKLLPNEPVTIRLLEADDAQNLTDYFDGLSGQTRSYFAPHPFDLATVQHICGHLDPTQIVRLIATTGNGDQIIAYTLVMSGVTPSDAARYQAVGVQLDPKTDCSFAPSIADSYQSRGLGGHILQKSLEIAHSMNKRRVILWGGVQASNERAVRYYRKYGFIKLTDFERNGLNYAMCRYLS